MHAKRLGVVLTTAVAATALLLPLSVNAQAFASCTTLTS